MSFWKTYGFHITSAIDTILESSDFTLEQLLDEEDILQETKSQNKKLLEFLTKPSTLEQLIKYITEEPQIDEKESDLKLSAKASNLKFKYPFLACEILSSDVWPIINPFFDEKNNWSFMDKLFGLFEKDPPLNALLASYTSRVAASLLNHEPKGMVVYLQQKNNIVSTFLKHIGNASVMDFLLKIITCEDKTNTQDWLSSTELISSLISKFDISNSADVHENASQVLSDVITVSLSVNSTTLIQQMESETILNSLFSHILNNGISSSLLHGVAVVVELLRHHTNEQHNTTATVDTLPTLLKLIVQNLDKFHSFIKKDQKSEDKLLAQPIGQIQPLGFQRLRIIEFFTVLLRTNYACIDAEMIKHGILSSCLDLFFLHEWNNFLHSLVEQMINTIIEGQNETLKEHLLTEAKLLDRICAASKLNEEVCLAPKGVRKGYMGQLTSISVTLVNCSNSESSSIVKILDSHEEWNKYVKGAFATTRERETKIIGGYRPTDFTHEDDDLGEEQYEGEISFGSNFIGSRESYSTEDKFKLEDDDDDDDDDGDDDEEEGVVVQSVLEDDEYQEEGNEEETTQRATQEVWEEKTIEDAPQQETKSDEPPKEQKQEEPESQPKSTEETAPQNISESQQKSDAPENS